MEWKGCQKFEPGKAAILDFKMADPKITFFRHISTKKTPIVLILCANSIIGINKHTSITYILIA